MHRAYDELICTAEQVCPISPDGHRLPYAKGNYRHSIARPHTGRDCDRSTVHSDVPGVKPKPSVIREAAIEEAVLRLRPIMITMLVATQGLIPAALSHAIGSDSQRPFAIVIVGGLIANLVMSIFLYPRYTFGFLEATTCCPRWREMRSSETVMEGWTM